MNVRRWSVILCAGAVLLEVPLIAQTPSVLEAPAERKQGPPLWISATAVADPDQVIDLGRVDSGGLRMNVQSQRRSLGDLAEKSLPGEKPPVTAIPASECRRTILSSEHRGGHDPSASLDELSAHSQTIVRGAVRSVEPGFGFGMPTSLLGVEVEEVLKGPSPSSILYVDYPVAHFKIGPLHFCNGETGYEPQPGDQVLLFDYTGPVDRDAVLYAPRFEQIFFGSQKTGTLIVPAKLSGDRTLKAMSSLAQVVARLRSGAPLDPRGVL